MYGSGWGMGWMGWMGIFWAVVVIAVILFVAFLVRHASSSGRPSAEDILRERYARGEISKAQYEEQLKTLRGQ